jgi:hypothetical protein
MAKSVIVVKVPKDYPEKEKLDLELKANSLVDTGGAIVIPDDVDIMVLAVN